MSDICALYQTKTQILRHVSNSAPSGDTSDSDASFDIALDSMPAEDFEQNVASYRGSGDQKQ